MDKSKLLETAQNLPHKPGCYLLKRGAQILYIGKAKNLKKRVSSYFSKSHKDVKTTYLVDKVDQFDFVITKDEVDAFVLENNLIKEHGPKYNIRLKDDATYPYVMVDLNEEFPTLKYIRRIKKRKNCLIFGPFVVGGNISNVMNILVKTFQLRDCSLRELRSRKTPCLLFEMKYCSAPCVNYISAEDYDLSLQNAINFFKGKGTKVLKLIETKMFEASDNEEFEAAAMFRDSLEILTVFKSQYFKSNADLHNQKNIDIWGYHIAEQEISISIYMVRNGILLGFKNIHFPRRTTDLMTPEEELNFSFFQYYHNHLSSFPEVVITPFALEECEMLSKALGKSSPDFSKTTISPPKAKWNGLQKLAIDHAFEKMRVRKDSERDTLTALTKLQELLGLKTRPINLECYDVAIWQGSSPTGSMVVYTNGVKNKNAYRHFHLTERPEGNNDFAMMEELIQRRVKKGHLPDVFIVDGGPGQVGMFKKVLHSEKVDIPVIGIAKAKVKGTEKTEERLVIPNRQNHYVLKKCMPLFRLVTTMRDEAHRFSRRLHHRAENKKFFNSIFDSVKGIGPATKKKILSNYDGPQDFELSISDLVKKWGINEKLVRAIKFQHQS
jgi:excinuclease ABC subunit C